VADSYRLAHNPSQLRHRMSKLTHRNPEGVAPQSVTGWQRTAPAS
jgi:hypothetical protein